VRSQVVYIALSCMLTLTCIFPPMVSITIRSDTSLTADGYDQSCLANTTGRASQAERRRGVPPIRRCSFSASRLRCPPLDRDNGSALLAASAAPQPRFEIEHFHARRQPEAQERFRRQ
jgi:hypothetical protein